MPLKNLRMDLHRSPYPRLARDKRWKLLRGLALSLLLVAATAYASAATLEVPSAFATIQAAIDASVDGDVVLVAPGVYQESITLSGKNITLASYFTTLGDPGLIDQTILDGGGENFIISVEGPSGVEPTITGFTLRNASDGIIATGRFIFENNRVIDTSDGIDYEDNSGGIVRSNVFENNSDDGIDLDRRVDILIEHNVIRNNGDDGIEIRLHDFPFDPTVNLSVVIRDNEISGNGEDGIQLIDDETLTSRVYRIERNLILNNADAGIGMMPDQVTKENFGGADLGERVLVINNTIVGNNHGITGGDNLIVLNNLIVGTTNIGLKRLRVNSIAAFNLFFNNGTDFSDVIVDQTTSVSGDPLLDANFELMAGSPAIDAGTALFEHNGEIVVDLPATAYSGAAPDIGAMESDAVVTPEPPVADAGADQVVDETTAVTLDGSNSSDPNGDTLTFAWLQTGGPAVVLSGVDTAAASFTAPDVTATQVLTFQLTVSDPGGLSSVDAVDVSVNDVPPLLPPVADAGADQTVDESTAVTLDGSNSSDPDGDTLTFAWSQIAGPPVQLSGASSAVASFTAPQVAATQVLTFQLIVTDPGGLTAVDTVDVSVADVPPASPPVADAGADQTVNESTAVTLDGSGSSDPDGETLTFSWSQTAGPTVQLSGANSAVASFTAPDVSASQELTFVLTVTDPGGLTSNDAASVVVNDVVPVPPPQPPVADAGADQTVTELTAVTLDGNNSSDPDGDALTFVWLQTAGPAVQLSAANAAIATFTAPDVIATQTLTFELTVTDPGGMTASDTVNVQISDTPLIDPPIGRSGGSGSMDWWLLALLAVFAGFVEPRRRNTRSIH